jgi:hypothetical protein
MSAYFGAIHSIIVIKRGCKNASWDPGYEGPVIAEDGLMVWCGCNECYAHIRLQCKGLLLCCRREPRTEQGPDCRAFKHHWIESKACTLTQLQPPSGFGGPPDGKQAMKPCCTEQVLDRAWYKMHGCAHSTPPRSTTRLLTAPQSNRPIPSSRTPTWRRPGTLTATVTAQA